MKKEELLAQMTGRAITNGWDVVCAMSAERISKLFEDKYNREETSGVIKHIVYSEESFYGTISFDFFVGPPLISFIKDDEKHCMLRIEIKKGQAVAKNAKGEEKIQNIPKDPNDPNHYYITATIPLAITEGKVKNGHDVVINFEETAEVHIDLNFDPMIMEEAESAMKNYYAKELKGKDWSLGTLIYDEIPDLIYLTPTSFEFATSVRPYDKTDTGCLLLFITTKDGQKGTSKELTGKDGRLYTPYPDGHSAALIISNKVLYGKILLGQMNSNTTAQWAFKPGEAGLTAGCLSCIGGSVKYKGYHCKGLDQWDISGFKLNCNEGEPPLSLLENMDDQNTLKFQWIHNWNVHWVNTYVDPDPSGGGSVTSSGDTPMKLSIINPTVKISVSEPSQVISFDNHATVIIEGPSKPKSDWKAFLETFLGESVQAAKMIEESFNAMLPKINYQFKGVNVFAVSNLLFPEYHVITYDSNGVYIPGDLVIFGTTKSKL
jgi:hypothetical protein